MADTHAKHDYHIIDPSPWPFLASAGAFIMMIGLVGFMRYAAGGQFVNRFVVGSPAEDAYPSVSFRYIISNPSSYKGSPQPPFDIT